MATGLQLNLNRVIGRTDPSTFLDAQGAANAWINTNLINDNLATGTDSSGGSTLTGVGIYSGGTTTSSTDYAQSGSRSLKVVPNAGVTSISIGTVAISSIYVPVILPGRTYNLTVYARTAIALSNPVSLIAIPQEVLGTNLTPVTLTTTTAVSNGGWTKITGQFTAASNHNYLVLKVTVNASGANLDGQNYYFDTFSIQQGTSDPANNLNLIGALNVKAGTVGAGLNKVCNIIAGTSNLDANKASEFFV